VGEIRAGSVFLFYLFDIAESVDLRLIPGITGGPTESVRLQPKQPTPPYVQYDNPPVSFDGDVVGIPDVEGFRPRFRLYDYGVMSIALSRPFSGSWGELVALGQGLIENVEFEQRAEELCRRVADRLRKALTGPRQTYLTEDYLVYVVNELEQPQSADDLLATRGGEIAAMLRGERQPLSDQERAAVLQHRISYLADDLVIPTWNAAFVYDTPSGAQAALEILEFANSQLLEFRYYDERLDNELSSIYSRIRRPRWYDQWVSARYTTAAREVQALLVDVNELTDRTENALKFIGDIYTVRVFFLVAARLGLGTWKADVEAKLKTLDDIYRFAVEQSSMSRGQFLELTIVLILIFELVLIFLGVMQ
jgi:hypothetical protein